MTETDIKELWVIANTKTIGEFIGAVRRLEASKSGDLDERVYMAVAHLEGKWPRSQTSGIMFFDGLRITRAEFRKAARETR